MRKNARGNNYGKLTENEVQLDVTAIQRDPGRAKINSPRHLEAAVSEAAPAHPELPRAIVIGIKMSLDKESAPDKVRDTTTIIPMDSSMREDPRVAEPSIESLITTHMKQTEQRERFIHDRRNIGLRHMALQQIREQQKYEKRIMNARIMNRTKELNYLPT